MGWRGAMLLKSKVDGMVIFMLGDRSLHGVDSGVGDVRLDMESGLDEEEDWAVEAMVELVIVFVSGLRLEIEPSEGRDETGVKSMDGLVVVAGVAVAAGVGGSTVLPGSEAHS